jgi:hypothetical protein
MALRTERGAGGEEASNGQDDSLALLRSTGAPPLPPHTFCCKVFSIQEMEFVRL